MVKDKKEDGGAVEPEKKKELKEFLGLAFAIVEREHAQMPKVCSICGGGDGAFMAGFGR